MTNPIPAIVATFRQRREEAADWLQAQGWNVQPPNPDARACLSHGGPDGPQAEG